MYSIRCIYHSRVTRIIWKKITICYLHIFIRWYQLQITKIYTHANGTPEYFIERGGGTTNYNGFWSVQTQCFRDMPK